MLILKEKSHQGIWNCFYRHFQTYKIMLQQFSLVTNFFGSCTISRGLIPTYNAQLLLGNFRYECRRKQRLFLFLMKKLIWEQVWEAPGLVTSSAKTNSGKTLFHHYLSLHICQISLSALKKPQKLKWVMCCRDGLWFVNPHGDQLARLCFAAGIRKYTLNS